MAACGCNSRSLEGTWEGGVAGANNTITVTGPKAALSTTIMGATVTISADQSYDQETGRLKLTNLTYDAPSVPPAMMEQARSRAPKEMELTISWKNNDEIVVQGQQSPLMPAGTFKRKKQ